MKQKADQAAKALANFQLRFVQIEITTICNFRCFYCAGRDMPQEHLGLVRFEEILDSLPRGPFKVSLQGEGEPTAHPDFWTMAQMVSMRGKTPYTITNGSNIDVQRAATVFQQIGVSLDTLDREEADRIGRYKLHKVLANVDSLVAAMGPDRVIIHTVNYGQPLDSLRAYLAARGLGKHLVQPLQSKPDYSYRYPTQIPIVSDAYHYRCPYVTAPFMRYYDMRGNEMPCCFIKDHRTFVSTEHIVSELEQKRVPESCVGCRAIKE